MTVLQPIIPALIVLAIFVIYIKKKSKRAELEIPSLNKLILGAIYCARDLLTYKALYFTADKIIVAKTVDDTGALSYLESKPIAVQLGQKPLDDILHADKTNFDIPYSIIRSIEVRKAGLIGSPHITVVTQQQNILKFSFLQQKLEEVINIVKKACPDKLTDK